MSDEKKYKVGYGRPPAESRWKKGQSGCPSGGHAQRKRNELEKVQADLERRERSIKDLIKRVATEKVVARTKDGDKEMTRLEAVVRTVFDAPHRPNARPNAARDVLALCKSQGLLDPTTKERAMVLVVPATMPADEWAKATEGERMSKNPLEGIPGAENLLSQPARSRKSMIEDDE